MLVNLPSFRLLASIAGVKLSKEWRTTSYYDGHTVYCGGMSDHDVLHEISHALVARPEQLDLPEFGLGSFCDDDVPRVVDFDEAWIQEHAAGLVSTILGKRFRIEDVTFGGVPFSSWEHWIEYRSNCLDCADMRRWRWAATALAAATMNRLEPLLE